MTRSHSKTARRGAHDAPRARQSPHGGPLARQVFSGPGRPGAVFFGNPSLRPSATSADRPRASRSSFSNRRAWSPSAHGAGIVRSRHGSSGACRASSLRSPQHPPPPTPGGPTSRTRATTHPESPCRSSGCASSRRRRAAGPRPRHRHLRGSPTRPRIDGSPAIISDDYFDLKLVEGTELAAPEDTTREDILKEAGFEQTYDVDEIITRMPTPDEADRLGIQPGTPVAEHRRVGYTELPTRPTNDLRRARRQHRPATSSPPDPAAITGQARAVSNFAFLVQGGALRAPRGAVPDAAAGARPGRAACRPVPARRAAAMMLPRASAEGVSRVRIGLDCDSGAMSVRKFVVG